MVVTGRASLLALVAVAAVAVSGDIGGIVTFVSVGLVVLLVALPSENGTALGPPSGASEDARGGGGDSTKCGCTAAMLALLAVCSSFTRIEFFRACGGMSSNGVPSDMLSLGVCFTQTGTKRCLALSSGSRGCAMVSSRCPPALS